mgnify:CR=1 FL=1
MVKSSINGDFPIAMFDYQRVSAGIGCISIPPPMLAATPGHVHFFVTGDGAQFRQHLSRDEQEGTGGWSPHRRSRCGFCRSDFQRQVHDHRGSMVVSWQLHCCSPVVPLQTLLQRLAQAHPILDMYI